MKPLKRLNLRLYRKEPWKTNNLPIKQNVKSNTKKLFTLKEERTLILSNWINKLLNNIKYKLHTPMIELYKNETWRKWLVRKIIKLILKSSFMERVKWVEVLEWDSLLMIKVNKVEQQLVVSGERKEMDNTVLISKVILIQLQSKINFEMCKIMLIEDTKDL